MELNQADPPEIEQEERFRDLFDSAHDLIHFARPNGELIYVNRSWINILGFEEAEIIGCPIYSFIHPEELEAFKNYRDLVLSGTAGQSQIITSFVSKDGTIKKLEGFISIRMKDGLPSYTRGIFRDVTSRFENEERLRTYTQQLKEREDNLHQLLINAPDAIIVINREGRVSFWNPKAEQLFGWGYEEVLGRPLSQIIIPPQHRSAHDNGMKRYLATGEGHVLNQTIEITALNRKREEFFVSLTISTTVQDGDVAFIAFIRDISAQKKNEQELARKTAELETSNRELEHFAHVASHDMKEPIRKVKIFNDRLQEEFGALLPEQGQVYLSKIRGAASRLSLMVDGVLDHSMISTNNDPFEPVNLSSILADIESDLELVIREKKATISYGELPSFNGISFLIYQLFYNLLNNSLKFSRDDRAPVINITGEIIHSRGRIDGPAVSFQITDNGIGFSQEHADKIFQTFTRLHAKHQYEGTGLGLALCKTIAERHGGFIEAHAEEGKGARFRVVLPLTHQR